MVCSVLLTNVFLCTTLQDFSVVKDVHKLVIFFFFLIFHFKLIGTDKPNEIKTS